MAEVDPYGGLFKEVGRLFWGTEGYRSPNLTSGDVVAYECQRCRILVVSREAHAEVWHERYIR